MDRWDSTCDFLLAQLSSGNTYRHLKEKACGEKIGDSGVQKLQWWDFQLGGSEGHSFGLEGHSIGTATGLLLRIKLILCKSLILMPIVKFVKNRPTQNTYAKKSSVRILK